MLEKKIAFICNHTNQLRFNRPSLPKFEDKWLKVPTDDSLRALYTTKRKEMWVPYFIGTNQDPYYDERLTWEGKCDRLTQVGLYYLIKAKMKAVISYFIENVHT